MKHSPGPWHVTNDGEFVDHGQAALVRAVNANEADMKLIAAAPELLDALRDAEAEIACAARSNTHVLEKARAAIDKATK